MLANFAQTKSSLSHEHPSQYYVATWKEKGESRSVIADKARLRMKFGVLKVSNLKRSLSHGGLHAGNASSLKADMQLLMVDHLILDGRYIPDENQEWSEFHSLDWYDIDWDLPLRDPDKAEETVSRLKAVLKQPTTMLSDYLSNESIDLLLIGRDAYLRLFYTLDNPYILEGSSPFFLGHSQGARFLGTYKLRVTIYCNETTIDQLEYRVHFKAWNDFTIEEVRD